MTSEPLEIPVLAVFNYWLAYVGGEKIKIDRNKGHNQTDEKIMLKYPSFVTGIFHVFMGIFFLHFSVWKVAYYKSEIFL